MDCALTNTFRMDKYSLSMSTQAQTRYEEIYRRIEAALGKPVPRDLAPTSPEFDALMAEIRARDPKLWKEVIDEISGASPLPSEKEAAEEEARRKAASTLLGLFLRPDGLRTGKKRLNKTSLGLLGGAALLAIGMLFQGQQPRRQAPSPPPLGGIVSPRPALPTPRTPQPSPTPSPSLKDEDLAQTVPPVPPAPTPQPSPRHTERPASPPAGTADLPLPPPAPLAQGSGPQPQTSQGPQGQQQPGMLFRARQQRSAETAPVLYRSASQTRTGQEQPQPLAFKAQADSSQRSGAVLFRAGQQPPPPQQQQQEGTPPAAPQESLRPGQVFQAVLALPVSVSPAWGPVPALAEVTDGPLSGSTLWGQARMSRDGSVEITFTQVFGKGGRGTPFNGVAYDPVAGRPALSGQVRTVMPNALQTILSSSLQAASEYFKARVESQSVTITNGFVTIQQREPSFWDVYSRSLAQAMTPRTPEGSGPVVVAHLPRGTVISVIVMGQ
jgi:hypothetical protein